MDSGILIQVKGETMWSFYKLHVGIGDNALRNKHIPRQ
jgi:hypothetical protein